MYNTADIGLAGRFFGSQRSFMRVLLRNATSLSPHHALDPGAGKRDFGSDQTILGFPQGVSELDAIPLPERFFGGGADSLRAFSYNQAGPRDIGSPVAPEDRPRKPTGFPLGGKRDSASITWS